ncbi:MAG: hypothetical protein AAFY02_14445 [Pseudomonadota bacterium]
MTVTEVTSGSARVAFPGMTLAFPDQGRLLLGPGGFLISRVDEAGLRRIDQADLDPPVIWETSEDETFTLRYLLDHASATWDEARDLLLDLSLAARNVAMTSLGPAETGLNPRLFIDQLDVSLESEAVAYGRFDQTGILVAEGLLLDPQDGRTEVDRFQVTLAFDGADQDLIEAWRERLDNLAPGERPSGLPPVSSLASRASLELALQRWRVWPPEDSEMHPPFADWWLDDLTLRASAWRENEGQTIGLSLLSAGTGIGTDAPGQTAYLQAARFVAEDWYLPMQFTGIPVAAIDRLLADWAAGASEARGLVIDPESPIDYGAFFQAVGRAGVELEIDEARMSGESGAVSGSLQLTFEPNLPLGVFGEADFVLSGVDDTAEALGEVDDPTATRFAFFVTTFLKGLGQAEVGPEGEIVYRYRIEIDRSGTSTLNGLPLNDLFNR